ncbi:MAG: prolipoprotein diacylglyceryl transferase [Myxococcota bacterium]|nr:prolipoprotein diacylglyceryl transferase [Myxococcota bacterium]
MRWNLDPIITQFSIGPFGPIELRWYGLLFATGLLLCAWAGPRYFQIWGVPKQHAERLTLWIPIGMLLGAHYIHLVFYEWEGLFDFPRFDEDGDFVLGRFFSLGSGLASHGGALGCILALLIFWWRYGKPLGIAAHRYYDAVMITAIWVFPFVRLGNFANSEIVGRVTDGPWGVIFERWGYQTARHPVVLYEAALYFAELAFAVLWFQPRYARKLRPGATFYFFLMVHFTLRFIAEFAKESQGVDEGWALNMGHLLSLPIVIGCAYMIFGTKRFNILQPLTAEEKADIEESARRAAAYEAALEAETGGKKSAAVGTTEDDDAKPAAKKSRPTGTKKKKKGGGGGGGKERGVDA